MYRIPAMESGCLEFPEIPPAEHPESCKEAPVPIWWSQEPDHSREVAEHLNSASQMPTEPGRN